VKNLCREIQSHIRCIIVAQVLGGGEGNIALMRDLAEENDKLAAENMRLTSKCVVMPRAAVHSLPRR